MKGGAACAAGILVVSVSSAWAQDLERVAMAQVRLSTDAAVARGCTRIGQVSDDSIKDLRRKIVRGGGDTAVLAFGGIDDLSRIYADVFRCAAPSGPPSAVPPLPPDVPPPPPGPPPPAPPGPSR